MSIVWFACLAMLALGGFLLGRRAGRANTRVALIALVVSVMLIGTWAWLMHNPAVLVRALPVWMLSRTEGVGAVPLFMIVIGVAWSRAKRPRQRRMTALAACFGVVYFLQGSMWMLQSTPAAVLGAAPGSALGQRVVMQSQDFTCVPASCATALHHLGIRSTEAEMAALTEARPGTGSTMIRAMHGLRRRLAGTGISLDLVEPDYDQLRSLSPPLLTPLRLDPRQLHMVVILSVHQDFVRIADPQEGVIYMTRQEFDGVYTGQVLCFARE